MKKSVFLLTATLLWGSHSFSMDPKDLPEIENYLSILQDRRTLATQKQEIASLLASLAQHPSSSFALRFKITEKMLDCRAEYEHREKAMDALFAILQEPTTSGETRFQAHNLLEKGNYWFGHLDQLRMTIAQDPTLPNEARLNCGEKVLYLEKEIILPLLNTLLQDPTLPNDTRLHYAKKIIERDSIEERAVILPVLNPLLQDPTLTAQHKKNIWEMIWKHSPDRGQQALAGYQLLKSATPPNAEVEMIIFHRGTLVVGRSMAPAFVIMAAKPDLNISYRLWCLECVYKSYYPQETIEAMSLSWAIIRDSTIPENHRIKALPDIFFPGCDRGKTEENIAHCREIAGRADVPERLKAKALELSRR